jgi:hypothetical protein
MKMKLMGTLFFAAACLFAQGERGSVTGIVTDSSGAVVPGATVTVTETATNAAKTTTTTDTGLYRIPSLPPGQYKVTATKTGFKVAVLSPLMVAVAAVASANLVLEVGSASESVTVAAEAGLVSLDAANAEVRRTITSAEYHTWPAVSMDGQRQTQILFYKSLPGTVGDEYQGTINGGQYFSHDILVEGMSVGQGFSTWRTPSSEAISDFSLQSGTLSPQYGSTQTAVANFNVRSGTNGFHGSVYEAFQNDKLNANTFANNATGLRNPPVRLNNWGAPLGGPLVIPHVYDGRNKTFWFFDPEWFRQTNLQPLGTFAQLPTAAMKTGDFSALLNPAFTGDPRSGTVVNGSIFGSIYDPASTLTAGGQQSRTVFPGNIIPASRQSAVSKSILSLAPLPDPFLSRFLNNQPLGNQAPRRWDDIYSGKLNHIFNTAHRIAFYADANGYQRASGSGNIAYFPYPGSATSLWSAVKITGSVVRLTEDWVITPHVVNHFGVGYNRLLNYGSSLSADQNWPGRIGLSGVGSATFPAISFTGTATQGGGLSNMGVNAAGGSTQGSTIVVNDSTWVHGGHTFKFGVEVRKLYYNSRPIGNTSGSFTFAPNQTANPNNVNNTGFAFASFLLGSVYSGSVAIAPTSPGFRTWYPAIYFGDDWKITPRLTMNLGLRWEIAGALKEVAGRLSNLDPGMGNPGADGFRGALVVGGNTFMKTNFRDLGPRIGFAYQVNKAIVARGGYGINFVQPYVTGASTSGFNGVNNFNASQLDPAFAWDQGVPAYPFTLPNTNPALQNGSTITYTPPNATRMPYTQNYNFNIQWLVKNTLLDIGYIGNHGVRLPGGFGTINQAHIDQLVSLGDKLLDNISLHPEIARPYPSFTGTVAQAIRPYPQFNTVNWAYPNFGSSSYNSLQVTATKRMTSGLSFLATYVYGKALTDVSGQTVQDIYNRGLARGLANFDHRHDLKFTQVYDLPFGKGKKFLNNGGVVNAIFGNWTITGIQQYRSGDALKVTTSISTSTTWFSGGILPDMVPGVPVLLGQSGLDYKNGTPWLNPAAFARPAVSAKGVPLAVGNAPNYFSGIRGPWYYNEDIGLLKKFPLSEKRWLQLRADAFKAFNRQQRGNPVTNIDNPLFGRIVSTISGVAADDGPRVIQLEGRIYF